jgi:hypothetical protein
LNNYITVYPYPAPQGINQSGDTLFAIQGAVSYQWYLDGNIIPGATEYFYVAPISGNYNVVATDVNNCEVEAVIFDVIANITPLSFGEGSGVRLFPNPVIDKLEIKNLATTSAISAKIYNSIGTEVQANELIPVSSGNQFTCTMDVAGLSSGTYILEIFTKAESSKIRFIKK